MIEKDWGWWDKPFQEERPWKRHSWVLSFENAPRELTAVQIGSQKRHTPPPVEPVPQNTGYPVRVDKTLHSEQWSGLLKTRPSKRLWGQVPHEY